VSQLSNHNFIELERFILDMGYDEKTAAMVIGFLKTQNRTVRQEGMLELALTEVKHFVEKKLKPRYVLAKHKRLLALIDITIDYEESTIYFIKHLFNPGYDEGQMLLVYAYMRYVAPNRYEIAYLQPNGEYCIVHRQLGLKDCLKVLETDPLFEP
jgi:hypothetical protein